MSANIFDRANDLIRSGESSLVNLLSAVAPWGAPLAPAWMSFSGMQSHLSYPWWVALVIAFVIEILGLATVHTTILFWRHNRRYTKEFRQMPTLLAGGMFILYLVIVLTVNVVMELPQGWEYTPILARALLSLLAVPAAVTMAIRTQHTELLNEIDEKKHRSFREKSQPKSESFQKVSAFPSDWRKLSRTQKRELAGMTPEQIAGRAGVTERTAFTWRAKLNANGFHEPTEN